MLKTTALFMGLAMTASAAVKIEKVSYKGWPNCYRVTNGEVELVITGDIGPRIMRLGFVGGQNFLKEYEESLGNSGEKEWQLRGGHRIWVGPEDIRYTYAPDNGPVKIAVKGDILEATQPVEPMTGIEKQLVVRMAASGTRVDVIHRLRNTTNFALEFAPWALTMMAPGGTGITGFPPRGTHPEVLPPTNPLVMWAYTDLSDPRWTFTKKYLALRQDPAAKSPQKLGHFNPHTWGGYLLNGELFLKQFEADPGKVYPDFGCSYETYTNADMLEIETMGPLTKVEPGGVLEHVERWSLHRNVRIARITDEEIDRELLLLLKK
jgi:hypothetical protein